ncbi:unnamed protein product, partial [Bubo scandiacus]
IANVSYQTIQTEKLHLTDCSNKPSPFVLISALVCPTLGTKSCGGLVPLPGSETKQPLPLPQKESEIQSPGAEMRRGLIQQCKSNTTKNNNNNKNNSNNNEQSK